MDMCTENLSRTLTDHRYILLADKSPSNLRVVVECLENHGHNVRVAGDGKETVQYVADAIPGLILIDVHLPGMDGFEVCRRLKAQDRTRDIPLILMSVPTMSTPEDKLTAQELGAREFLCKPLQLDRLVEHVETCLGAEYVHR